MRKLTETEEAICAASIENSLLMRRIIRLMPGGMPTLDYLEMLYAYATLRHRKSDLANVLLGATCYDVPHAGRDWFDWYLEIKLPGKAPDFFFLVQRYGWIRTKLELGNFAEEEDAEGTLLFLDLLKEVAGTGIIAFDDVVRQVRKIDKAQVEENEAEMREFIAAQKGKAEAKMTKTNNRKYRVKVLTVASACLLSVHCMADTVKRQVPVPLGVSIAEEAQFPNADSDIMGFRLCLLYGRHANVSGLDIGVFGCAVDGCLFGLQTSVILNSVGSANGALQIGGIANNCLEDFYGVQLSGIANKADGSVYGGQLSTFNIAKEVGGTQIGVYNKADKVLGVQIGVINWATDMQGIQLGVLNVIKNGPCPYLPILNANF